MTQTPVIVLNWNGWDDTIACLRSLRDTSDVMTVWLVDNASTDDRSDEARLIWPDLRVLRLDRNYGFAGGMNRAIQTAASEGHVFAYLLNNDTTVRPGFLRAALEVARRPDVAVVGSCIAYGDSSGSLIFDRDYYGPGEKQASPSFLGSRIVASVNGAGMLVRLAAVQRVGYFDERYFCYHEEVDLCRRLTASGWLSAVAGDSLVLHKRRGSDRGNNALYYRVRNRFLLAEKSSRFARIRRTMAILRGAAALGRQARRRGESDAWETLAAAVYDGTHGRFGEREPTRDTAAAHLQFRLLCALMPTFAAGPERREWMRKRPASGSV